MRVCARPTRATCTTTRDTHRWTLLDALQALSACACRVIVGDRVSVATATVCLMDWWLFWGPMLGSALGGAVITTAFAMWKHFQDRRDEHARWLRDEKHEAYIKFMSAVQGGMGFFGPSSTPTSRDQGLMHFADMPTEAVSLLAPPDVWESVRPVLETTMKLIELRTLEVVDSEYLALHADAVKKVNALSAKIRTDIQIPPKVLRPRSRALRKRG